MREKIIDWLNNHHMPVRLLMAVAAGIVFSMAASGLTHEVLHLCGVFPPLTKPMFDEKLVVIELIYHSIYAVFGAVITARIAKDKARKAVFFLGSKEAIMWLLGIVLLWKHTFPWYNLSKAVLGIPLALVGGYLYRKYFEKSPAEKKTARRRHLKVSTHARSKQGAKA